MRILIHDYAGHPFQVQLSRALAQRGHDILHVYSGSNPTPQGAMVKRTDDPASFAVEPIVLKSTIQKGNLIKRRQQEIEHGRGVVASIENFRPDIVVSANCPLDAQQLLQSYCQKSAVPVVYWLQDLIGRATFLLLKNKLPIVGAVAGQYYMAMEKRLLRQAARIVAIADDFAELLPPLGVSSSNVRVIENWAPLEEMPVHTKPNAWSRAKGFDTTTNFIYSGTLGMKHNPALLLRLAESFRDCPEVRVIVISEGPGRQWLEAQKTEKRVENLHLFDYQPFAVLPEVLASADVLLAILEPSAGVLSVPSKVMTYMCAARPMLLAVPKENLAARTVERNKMGLLAEPDDQSAFVAGAKRLYESPSLREECARNARNYAEKTFDIQTITDRFEQIFRECIPPNVAKGGTGAGTTADGALVGQNTP